MSGPPAADAAADYRPVSPLAVAALCVGCASALALVTRFAWAVPLLGAALASAALIDLGRPGSRKAGRLVALAALGLSIGFGTQAVAAALVERWIVAGRARAAATAWLDAVREGRAAEALSMSAATVLPAAPPPPDAERAERGEERLRRFTELQAVRAVAGCAAARPRVVRASAAGTDDGGWLVDADLSPCGIGDATLRLAVVPTRDRRTTGQVERWRIAAAELVR